MSTTAVTPGTPAAPTESKPERNSERHAEFLPTDKHYRMTGEMPASSDTSETSADTAEASAASSKPSKKEEIETPSEKVGASAAPASDIAAASEAAKAAEEEKKAQTETKITEGKTAAGSESRWQKLSRENKELRERMQRLETPAKRETQQASQPAADAKTQPKTAAAPKPKIDDVDPKTGKARFATFAEYEEAKDTWNRQDVIRELTETSAKTAKATEQQQAEQTIAREWTKRVDSANAKYPDFKEVALNPALPIKAGSVVDVFILDSAVGTDVLHHLGKNPQELDRINGLSPIAQARELLKIENTFSGVAATTAATAAAASSEKTSSAKPVTQAPRPPHQVSGKGTVTKDAVEQAVEDADQETYTREQNARDLARRKKG